MKHKLEDINKIPNKQVDKIAIIQGGSWGDNINSTLMLQPIKTTFPNIEIHVFTSDIYADAFYNNPLIDELYQFCCDSKNAAINLSVAVPPLLVDLGYAKVLAPHPMFNHDKWSCINHPEWGENLVFAWVRALEDNNIPYVSVETILCPTQAEKSKAMDLLQSTPDNGRTKTLMEVMGESGQTFFDFHWFDRISRLLVEHNHIIYISNKTRNNVINTLEDQFPNNVFFVGNLTIRECAVLFNGCQNFISVSSGLSNACNTNFCKKNINWIEIVNSRTCSSAAIRSDNKTFWHENDLDKFCEFMKNKL